MGKIIHVDFPKFNQMSETETLQLILECQGKAESIITEIKNIFDYDLSLSTYCTRLLDRVGNISGYYYEYSTPEDVLAVLADNNLLKLFLGEEFLP